MKDQDLIKHLFAAIEERDAIIKTVIPELQKRITELEDQLAIYQNRKDSSNSHKPPSTDMNTPQRNKSLRKKSNKKPGGQKGHQGSTLLFSDQIDKTILRRSFCNYAGNTILCKVAPAIGTRRLARQPDFHLA